MGGRRERALPVSQLSTENIVATTTPTRPPRSVRRPRVLLEIARFEARKIWRHPALIAAAIITIYQLYQQINWSVAPVLNRDSYTSAWPMVIYAAGVYLAVGTTVNRRHGAQDEETLGAFPVTPLTRTLGTGLAFVSPLLVAIVMQGTVLAMRALNGPVTSIVWSEALTGPLTVALGAAAGMAVGWTFRASLAVPLAGLVFLGGTLVVWWEDFLFGPYTPWLAPVPSLDRNQYAFEQAYRPSDWHLLYLLLLTAFFVAVATVRGRRRRGWLASIGLTLVLLAGVVWVGMAQLAELTATEEATRRSRYIATTGDYVCQQRDTVTYCAYSGYEGWIDEWAAQIEPVLAMVPNQIAARPLEIRQQVPYFADDGEDLAPAGDLTAGMWWSRRSYDSSLVAHRLGMALAAAGWSVNLPTRSLPTESEVIDGEIVVTPFDPATGDPEEMQLRACHSNGQARAVAALWYAIQSSPEAVEALRFQTSGERYGGLRPQDNTSIDIGFRQPSSTVAYFRREALVALDLHELPPNEVSRTLSDHWDELTDPGTTTEDIASWFSVSVPEMNPADDSWTIACP